ncbi:MAG: hypothetical protein P1U58_00245 [Verrucomicrobiales bacterium]|nr:hypothetical protein [Verrucomicrobiales bacterium]
MKVIRLAILLTASLFLASCFDTSTDESVDGNGSETPMSGGDEGMSFPEALKLKRSLARELENLKMGIESHDELVAREAEMTRNLEEVRAYEQKLNAVRDTTEQSLNYWRDATRGSFVGVQIPTLSTESGSDYTNVNITNVGDEELKILHSGGSAVLEISDLPEGLRKNLIHEPTVAAQIFAE